MTRLLNAVQFAATSSGTGDFVVSSAIQGFQTPSADGAINGETYSYRAQNPSMSEWEIGIGTWNSGTGTLARTTVLASSTGSKVSFTIPPNVGLTPSKDDLSNASTLFVTGTVPLARLPPLREVLAANRTYYVRTDGNDGNSGLANTSGGAFAKPQAALNAAAKIDFNGFVVTIQIGDGTYTGYISIPAMVGQASVWSLLIQGNVTTPSNVVLTQAGSYQSTITVPQRAAVTLSAFRVSATNNGYGFRNSGGMISYSNIDFGACVGQHIAAEGGYTLQTGNVTISGGGEAHWNAGAGSIIKSQGRTITASTSVNFNTGFATAEAAGSIVSNGNTFSGTYTGPRYRGTTNGVIITNGGGANYFPGSSAGSLLTGAQYQ